MPWYKRLPKWVWPAVALLVLVTAACVWIFWPKQQDLLLSSIVQAQEIKNGSRVGGRVDTIFVEEGSLVKKGEPLVSFDNADLEAKLLEAKATLTQAKSQKALLAKGANPADLRQASARVQQAQQKLNLLSRGAREEELTQAEAKLEDARLQFEGAKDRYEQAEKTYEGGIISKQRFEQIKSAYESSQNLLQASEAKVSLLKKGASKEELEIARAELNAARASYSKLAQGAQVEEIEIAEASVQKAQSVVNALEHQLEDSVIKSPIDGTVTLVAVNPGELVTPGISVVTILDYDKLWTDLYVPESKLDYAQANKTVAVKAPVLKKAEFTGNIVFISPKSEFIPSGSGSSNLSSESSFRVKVSLNGQDSSDTYHLAPGMKVDVRFPAPN